METMLVHAYLLDMLDRSSTQAPDQWAHDCVSGALSFQFSGSDNSYSWDAEAVASMPVDETKEPSSDAGRALLTRWDTIRKALDELEHGDPDLVLVDHGEHETRLVWEEEKLVVIVEHEEPNAALDFTMDGRSIRQPSASPRVRGSVGPHRRR